MYLTVKKGILSGVKYICIALIWMMSIVIFSGVICRFLLRIPLVWAEEFSLTSMVWLAFLGSALAFELNSHVVVDFVANLLHGRKKQVLRVATSLMLVPMFSILIYAGYIMMMQTKNSVTPGMGISVAFLYMAAFISGILMLWLCIEKAVLNICSLVKGEEISLPPVIFPPTASASATETEKENLEGGLG